MTGRRYRMALTGALIVSLFVAGWASHRTNRFLEARSVEQRESDGEIGPLPDGKTLHVASLGFERVLADLFWIRTLYYVGDDYAARAGYPSAERLAQLVTDIDPHFDTVYVLMSSVLNGLRFDADAAIRLLEKGAAVSDYWRVHFLLGFNYFMEREDHERGAKALSRAVELGGPEYLQFLVSRLYAHAGDPTTAMAFVSARLQHEENPKIRGRLEKRLSDLWINRDLGLIDAAIAKYREAKKKNPASVDTLVAAGFLAQPPRDPKGGAYSIVDGKAQCALPYEVLKLKL